MVLVKQLTQAGSPRQYANTTNLPELLGRILSSNTLQNLRATGMLVDEVGHVVDVLVDDDVETLIGGVVGGDVGGGEGLGHFGVFSVLFLWEVEWTQLRERGREGEEEKPKLGRSIKRKRREST